jgi:hypothetical protein
MNKKIFLLVLLIMPVSVSGCAGLGQPLDEAGTRIKGGKETLIARGVSNDLPFWCGPGAKIVYEVEDEGFYIHDLATGRRVKAGDENAAPVACTHDGKWVVYRDRNSFRTNDNYPDHRCPVIDLWRYELSTGERQRVAVVCESEVSTFSQAVISPTGHRLFLGKDPGVSVEMPEPVWEVAWSNERKSTGMVLLSRSSALLGTYAMRGPKRDGYASFIDVMEVEIFEPERKIVRLYPQSRHFVPRLSDKEDRVYIRIQGEEVEGRVIERCGLDLEKEAISCVPVLELPSRNKRPASLCLGCPALPVSPGGIEGFDIFSDEETMVYTVYGDRCVRVKKIGEEEAGCLTSSDYRIGYFVTISPNERWLAFTVHRKLGVADGFDVVTDDLYVIELIKE